MAKPFTIPCELVIIPGGATRQNKISMQVNGEIAFEGYENDLSDGLKEAVAKIAEAESRLLSKWSANLGNQTVGVKRVSSETPSSIIRDKIAHLVTKECIEKVDAEIMASVYGSCFSSRLSSQSGFMNDQEREIKIRYLAEARKKIQELWEENGKAIKATPSKLEQYKLMKKYWSDVDKVLSKINTDGMKEIEALYDGSKPALFYKVEEVNENGSSWNLFQEYDDLSIACLVAYDLEYERCKEVRVIDSNGQVVWHKSNGIQVIDLTHFLKD